MRVYTYSEARQNLSKLLNQAKTEEVVIKRRDGTTFSVKAKKSQSSAFNVKGIKTDITKEQILDAVRESRES